MKAGDCIHFRGIQHATCLAGVEMAPLRDASGPGLARWPCLPTLHRGRPCATSCASFRAITEEEAAAEMEAVDAMIADIKAGMSPCCKAPLTGPAKGPGVRHCSACQEFVVRSCNPTEVNGEF